MEHVPRAKVVWTARGEWLVPADVVLIEPQWEPAIEALHELGIAVVHPEIRPAVVEVGSDLGVERLSAWELAGSIRDAGLSEVTPLEEFLEC